MYARNPNIAGDQAKQRQTVLVCCNSDVNLRQDAWCTTKINKTVERETAQVLIKCLHCMKKTVAYTWCIFWTPSRLAGYHTIAHKTTADLYHAAPHCHHLHRNGRARWTSSLALVQLFSESFVQKRLQKNHTCSIYASGKPLAQETPILNASGKLVECSSSLYYCWTWNTSVFKDMSNKKTHRTRHLISFCLLWDPDMLQHGPIALAMTSWPKLCTCEFRGFNHRVSRGIQPTCNLSTFKSNIQRILMKAIEMTAKHVFFNSKD